MRKNNTLSGVKAHGLRCRYKDEETLLQCPSTLGQGRLPLQDQPLLEPQKPIYLLQPF